MGLSVSHIAGIHIVEGKRGQQQSGKNSVKIVVNWTVAKDRRKVEK